MTSAFDAVLCDLDGVLRRWDTGRMLRLDRAYGLRAGTLAAAAFRPERLLPAVTGTVTDDEWRSAVADDLTVACGSREKARALVDRWSADVGTVDGDVLEVLTAARRRTRVVLVSNATTRLEADLERLRLADAVDAVVNSARLGAVKPDERVYRVAADVAGADVVRCLFVDDTPRNVAAAESLGMTGLHYRHVRQLRDALAP